MLSGLIKDYYIFHEAKSMLTIGCYALFTKLLISLPSLIMYTVNT
jgi:hypothetical protein